MSIINLAIFFLTFTTINGINPYCLDNLSCKCATIGTDEISFACDVEKTRKYVINIKKDDYLKIYCKNWHEWDNFKFTSRITGKNVNSVEFYHCGLSNKFDLYDIMKRMKVENTKALTLQSFEFLNDSLKSFHFLGFGNITRLTLSGSGIRRIENNVFNDLVNVEWIDLSDNEIDVSYDIFLPFIKLRGIDLSKNKLKTINQFLFNELRNLEYLNLTENQLVYVEEQQFSHLESLKYLNLSNNNITNLPANILSNLTNLEIIDISHNNLYQMSAVFGHNNKLSKIYLRHNIVPLIWLPSNIFYNLTNLQEVYLNDIGLVTLPETLFANSTSLKYINLNGNLLKTLPKQIFSGLQNVIELLLSNNVIEGLSDYIFQDMVNLRRLHMNKNHFTEISEQLFNGLKLLVELNLERNHLTSISDEALSSMKVLRIVKLSYNQLEFNETTKYTLFENNYHLRELYLSHNNIKHFILHWPSNGYHIKILDLSNNKMSSITLDDLLVSTKVIKMDLRYNRIKGVQLTTNKNLQDYFSLEREISVELDFNPLLCDCQLYNLLRLIDNRMPHLNYDYFKITLGDLQCILNNGTEGPLIRELSSSTYTCPEHEYFNIDDSSCPTYCTCYVKLADKLRIIDCSNKCLANFVINETSFYFEKNHTLMLNLENNFLHEIPSVELLKSAKLTNLLLSNNNISTIDLDRIPKNTLKVLELHNNNISAIDSEVVKYLNSNSLMNLTLSGNPLKCDCYIHDFYHFVRSKRNQYVNLNYVKCHNFDDALLILSTLSQMVCEKHMITIITISSITLIIITITFFLCAYYNPKLFSCKTPEDNEPVPVQQRAEPAVQYIPSPEGDEGRIQIVEN